MLLLLPFIFFFFSCCCCCCCCCCSFNFLLLLYVTCDVRVLEKMSACCIACFFSPPSCLCVCVFGAGGGELMSAKEKKKMKDMYRIGNILGIQNDGEIKGRKVHV
ncbi:hypothetical protein, unlikely [Trypanosoma brucei gambiense DAL972]|uniref:T. brucei spp.-specific protein n=1 Tax=Trypanosoma brucei gambiense (strain MHOM/CI/86/DAL972) TaxID=679716 RepID=C9ZRK7_TRYB9|nr:hypothetical protein, unlikely [Trypanosoma brucei gambiense DAL972]CBH12309.1 hypothetical protein, unlikely [Trypanosoma brucei gambiense DAL972]|eukprot:XP_011774590.1 hypothetical protein, unlikely [Trypanosoma brucei gambiense DAL972]